MNIKYLRDKKPIYERIDNFKKKYDLNRICCLFLNNHYNSIFQKYGSIIPTNDYDSDRIDIMGINFYDEFDKSYIDSMKNVLNTDSFDFDYYYLFKPFLGPIDFRIILSNYININPNLIKNVLLYTTDEQTFIEYLNILNMLSYEQQEKLLDFIKPISFNLLPYKESYYSIHTKEIYDYLTINDVNHNKEIEDELFDWQKCNSYFIKEMQYYFYNLIISNKDILNNEELYNKLILLKEYILTKVPIVEGKLRTPKEEYYTTTEEHYTNYDREAACCGDSETITTHHKRTIYVNTIDYKEKDILRIKRTLSIFIKMLLSGNIDELKLYEETNDYEFSKELLNCINYKKEKEKVYAK